MEGRIQEHVRLFSPILKNPEFIESQFNIYIGYDDDDVIHMSIHNNVIIKILNMTFPTRLAHSCSNILCTGEVTKDAHAPVNIDRRRKSLWQLETSLQEQTSPSCLHPTFPIR